ncbi:MAG: hypothetical protein UW04_C0010G0006 [Parcubacteria group bacterium GW2011_GWB1_43_8]|nr:MAG: hypothetical protein UW04_C0010G0006 [Parcubacteria group bacterium GW2011_GWB1_43_8]
MLKHPKERKEEAEKNKLKKIRAKTKAEIEMDESIEQNVIFCMWFSGSSK